MNGFKIEEWTYPDGSKGYRLYQRVGRWPFRRWRYVIGNSRRGEVVRHMRETIIGGPRQTDTHYYRADGNQDFAPLVL